MTEKIDGGILLKINNNSPKNPRRVGASTVERVHPVPTTIKEKEFTL